MSDWSATYTAQILAEHGTFVRALARSLVQDQQAVDDLEQSTWLTTLEHPPHAVRSVRGWLARVMQNLVRQRHRAEQRRTQREMIAAPREVLAPAENPVERELLLRSVVEAVLALHEPYRSAILMRYFEGLPPRRIAERHKLPVATVRSQLQRALAELRLRLDERHGGRRTQWTHGLAAIAGLELAKAAPAVVLAKLGLAAAAIVVTAASVPMLLPASKPTEDTVAISAPQAPPPSAPPARAPIAATPAASEPDRPVAGVAGVAGKVQDENGRPIAGATIGTFDEHIPLSATSDRDGSYRLELAPRDYVSLRAEASGYARSLLYDVELATGEDRRRDFTLALGGSLEGHVLDPDGQPVEQATLAIGPRLRQLMTDADGCRGWAVHVQRTTDAQGRFHVDGLSEGLVPLLTSAVGFPPTLGAASIHRGETTSVTIQLEAGAAVRGVARLEDGSPLGCAHIRASLDSERSAATLTSADGRYEIRGAPTGRVTLTARSADATKQAREVVELQNGGERRWDPVLGLGLELRGRVVDHQEKPMEHMWVELKIADAPGPGESRTTDRDGRFAVSNWRNLPTTIVVRAMEGDRITRPSLAWVLDARPGPEILIRVSEDAHRFAGVSGRLLSPSKEPLAGLSIDCRPMALDQYHDQCALTDGLGGFEVGPLAPTRYFIEAVGRDWGFNAIGIFDLKPGQQLELGDVVLPVRGRLVATLHREQLPSPERLAFAVMCVRPTTLAWAIDPERGIPSEAALPPGDYVLQVRRHSYEQGDHGFQIAQHFAIEPGEETLVEVPAPTLVSHRLRFVEGETAEPMSSVHYTLRDERGRVIVQDLVLKGLGVATFDLDLRIDPGRYRLVACSNTFRRAEVTLDLRAPASATLEIVLE